MNILSHEYVSLQKELCGLDINIEPSCCPSIFNLSSVPIIGTTNYIGCARLLKNNIHCSEVNYNIDNDVITPGQDNKCDYQIVLDKSKSIGNNFFWNNWKNNYFEGTTYVISYDTKNNILFFDQIKNLIKNYINNNSFEINNFDYTKRYFEKYFNDNDDLRMFSFQNCYFLYPSNLECIIEIEPILNDNSMKIKNIYLHTISKDIIIRNNQNWSLFDELGGIDFLNDIRNIPIYNQEFISTDLKNDINFDILFWFIYNKTTDKNVLVGIKKNINNSNKSILKMSKLIEYDKNGIIGIGSNTSPLFSFGSPMIKISQNKFLGIGHIKIKNKLDEIDESYYKKNSIIYFLQQFLHEFMKQKYSNDYIFHRGLSSIYENCDNGYIYMSYFYILTNETENENENENETENETRYKFEFSDPFLIIDETKKYKFTLMFSTGIYQENDNIVITSGIGDYYSSISKFKLIDVIEMCNHNIRTTNVSTDLVYKFLFINNISNNFMTLSNHLTINNKQIQNHTIDLLLNLIQQENKLVGQIYIKIQDTIKNLKIIKNFEEKNTIIINFLTISNIINQNQNDINIFISKLYEKNSIDETKKEKIILLINELKNYCMVQTEQLDNLKQNISSIFYEQIFPLFNYYSNDNIYKIKYQKYKSKYLNLKKKYFNQTKTN